MNGDPTAVEPAAHELAFGRPVLIVEGPAGRERADVVIAGGLAQARWTAWAIRYTSGFLCAAMRAGRADELDLPAMVRSGPRDPHTPVYGVGVDAATGIGTGISAIDRARTARVLAHSTTRPADLCRPGHVLPIRTSERGVLARRGNSEAAVDLCEIAGLAPVALMATVLGSDGRLLQGAALSTFARRHRVPVLRVDDVLRHRVHHGYGRSGRVRAVTERAVVIAGKSTRMVDFADGLTGALHTALIGASGPPRSTAPVYVIVECRHDDPLFGPSEWRERMDDYRIRVATHGGTLIYLRNDPDGRHTYAVADHELARGAVTAVLRQLDLADVHIVGWPDGTASQSEGVFI
ncbi:3,4-dihydroxy-2-butanone-4-phosphate synthase [Nocardia zapadnayensis]|uniref:3,4-dihydroxy-2-butanone-4-phosphate synthase n=1 Tax=Nocardia rhamnosiphila TaxID=426716 RepID=UPI002247F120|nr:3,4-dihydroxy-2-butanone-4-phosphate synthase [Nocardia zapadnayensis]MCX0269147.1 3,4-dihydroxy-2-butanone-4-phosphate synthase [Nocardia zapadnayensis]